jgi:hypothetical protein
MNDKIKILDTDLIYPKYDIEKKLNFYTQFNIISFNTYIRKNKDNIWYLIRLSLEYEYQIKTNSESTIIMNELLSRFLTEAYKIILFYKIDPDITDSYGYPLLYIDENQKSEEERLGLFFKF